MASESVIGGVIAQWASVTTTGFPQELWFDGVPIKRADGTSVSLPTVELIDGGLTPDMDFEHNPFEVTSLTFVVRATTLAEADSIVKRLKYGGGAVNAGAGYDFADSISLTSAIELREMKRTSEKRSREAARDPNAAPVHRVDVTYEVTTQRVGV